MNAIRPPLAAALALSFGIAACVPATTAPISAPLPAKRPVAAPAPTQPRVVQGPVSDSWMDAAATPGAWSYEDRGNLTLAAFTGPTSGTAFALQCWRPSGSISLIMAGQSGASPVMQIRTETATRTIAAQRTIDEFANVTAALLGSDPLLDAMALSKGRFAVEAEGLPALYLPTWAEVSRVIEDCR
jgi:hypothetical protein